MKTRFLAEKLRITERFRSGITARLVAEDPNAG